MFDEEWGNIDEFAWSCTDVSGRWGKRAKHKILSCLSAIYRDTNNVDVTNKKFHLTVEEKKWVEIVLTRRELNAKLNTAANNALIMVDDRAVEAMKTSMTGSAASFVEAAVSAAIETLNEAWSSCKEVEAVVQDALVTVVVEHTYSSK